MAISYPVRQAALFPHDDWPDLPPGHPATLARRAGFTVGIFPDLPGMVHVRALGAGEIERSVDNARSILAEHGRRSAAWFVPEAASPADLAARLRALGMIPFPEPPFEARHAAMVLDRPPPTGPPELEARPAATFEEFKAGWRVGADAFRQTDEELLRQQASQERLLWEVEASTSRTRTFVAVLDGEIVGSAAAIYGGCAVHLVGGATREDVRGRGVYRALVRARWDAAVGRGTPALAVAAESMSRPILERLGFTIVGWSDCLLDRFA